METKQVKPIGVCKKKKSCKYSKTFGGEAYYCDYLCMEGKRRPCPANKCTVYKRKTQKTVDK